MKRLSNTILLLCSEPKCRRMVLTPRADYEKSRLTKYAVFLEGVCDRCQVPGNFYGEEQEYYGTDGRIDWFKEEFEGKETHGE